MIWHKITTPIPHDDFMMQVKLDGKQVCLIREQGKLHAVENNCPHAGGKLSGGWCKHGHIICPIHRWEYNLETGRGATGQGDYIHVYAVKEEADGVYVGFKESWWKRVFG